MCGQAYYPTAEGVAGGQARRRRPRSRRILTDDLRLRRIAEERLASEPGERHGGFALCEAPRLVVPGDVQVIGWRVLHHLFDPLGCPDGVVCIECGHPVAALPVWKGG